MAASQERGGLVPVHPEPVDGQPDALRWVMPAGTLPFVGEPVGLPGPLRALVQDGSLRRVEVEPAAVVLQLGPARSWRDEGATVRRVLQEALAASEEWRAPAGSSADDVLRSAVEGVIAGEVGEYVRGHGGRIDLVDVRDGRVEVTLGGACEDCPARGLTLTSRFEEAVRARYPALREVVSSGRQPRGRRLVPLLPPRRR